MVKNKNSEVTEFMHLFQQLDCKDRNTAFCHINYLLSAEKYQAKKYVKSSDTGIISVDFSKNRNSKRINNGLGKTVEFSSIQNYQIPTESINPHDVIYMGCSYDDQLHPILLIQTSEKDYSIRLGKPCNYYDRHLLIQEKRMNDLIAYLKENGLVHKKQKEQGYNYYEFANLHCIVSNNWKYIRVMQYLHDRHQCDITDLSYFVRFIREHPTTKTLLKCVDEEHLSEFKSFLSDLRKEEWLHVPDNKYHALKQKN